MGKKVFTVLFTLLLIAAMGLGLYYIWGQRQAEQLERARAEELSTRIYTETLSLVEKRKVLRKQVEDTELEIEAIRAGTGTTQYLVRDLSSRMTQQVISLMLERGEMGVLGLSIKQFPGQDGYMSLEWAMDAAARGWKFCYSYDPKEAEILSNDEARALSLWLDMVSTAAAEMEFSVESAILFPSGTFSEEYIPILKRKGIDVVIHHGELEGHSIYKADEVDGIWYVGSAWWWRNNIASGKFTQVAETGGNLVVEIGEQDFGTVNPKTAFDAFDQAVDAMSLMVTGFEGMKEQQVANRLGDEAAEQALRNEIEELNREIEELNREIQRIENYYMAEYAATK